MTTPCQMTVVKVLPLAQELRESTVHIREPPESSCPTEDVRGGEVARCVGDGIHPAKGDQVGLPLVTAPGFRAYWAWTAHLGLLPERSARSG